MSRTSTTNIFEEIPGTYGAHWGLTDLYAEHEEELRKALASSKDFLAKWGCKKEIRYASVQRIDGNIFVTCYDHIDELPDITDTVLWEVGGRNEKCESGYDFVCKYHNLDPEKDFQKATDIMEECEGWFEDVYRERFSASRKLPGTATYDTVIEAVDSAENEADDKSRDCFLAMVDIAREHINAAKERSNAPWL